MPYSALIRLNYKQTILFYSIFKSTFFPCFPPANRAITPHILSRACSSVSVSLMTTTSCSGLRSYCAELRQRRPTNGSNTHLALSHQAKQRLCQPLPFLQRLIGVPAGLPEAMAREILKYEQGSGKGQGLLGHGTIGHQMRIVP